MSDSVGRLGLTSRRGRQVGQSASAAGRRKCRSSGRRNHKCRGVPARMAGRLLACFLTEMRKTDASVRQTDSISDTPGDIRHTADNPPSQRTVRGHLASKPVRSDRMARRPNAAVGVVCPRCGMLAARIIGRSESLPVIYLQCEDCGRTSVAPSGEQA